MKTIKGKQLIDLFNRIVEITDKAVTKEFNAVRHDPTFGENVTIFAHMDHGFFAEPDTKNFASACGRNDFGNCLPEQDENCIRCQQFLPDLFNECIRFNSGYYSGPTPQLLEIKIQRIWGTEITVTDYLTNEELMNCYFDQDWYPRKSKFRPQDMLRRLIMEATFLSSKAARLEKEHWNDDVEDYDLGCPCDYR